MQNHKAAVSALILGFLATAPVFADSVAVSSGPNGTVVTSGQPCRVVTGRGDGSNTTTVTTGRNGVSGNTTVSPGGSGSAVTVGSGSSSGAGTNCVVTRPGK
jgi:hypothetical protein